MISQIRMNHKSELSVCVCQFYFIITSVLITHEMILKEYTLYTPTDRHKCNANVIQRHLHGSSTC